MELKVLDTLAATILLIGEDNRMFRFNEVGLVMQC